MPPTPIRFGIIGCGAIAQRRHLPELANNPNAKIVAVADPVKDRVAEIAKQYKAKPYLDYKQLLKHPGIDAVVVCTPNIFHAPQTIDALRAGKHVLVEKPMATTREDAKAMIAAAKKAGKFLMIGQNQRLMPPHVKAKQILDTGVLGKPLAFRTTFKHGGPDRWSVDGAKSWFFKKDLAVMGVTGDLGVHKADLLRFLLGQEFAEVGGFLATLDKTDPATNKPIELDDNAYLTLKTTEGVIGSMMISWTNYGWMEDNFTTIFCTNGALYIGTDPRFGVIVAHRNGQKEYYELGGISTNTRQLNSRVTDTFTDCIRENKKPTIDGDEGYKSLDVILTAMEAAEQGCTLKIGASIP
jgi:predicted dehydrogenase